MRISLKTLKAVLILVCLAVLLGAATEAHASKPRLSVRSFDNKTDARVPASAITEMMTTELFNSGLFSLMERERLDLVGDEIRLGMSGLVDESTAPEVGRIKGAQYTMTGAVTVYYYNAGGGVVYVPGIAGAGAAGRTGYVTLDIRIIDTSTGEVVYAAAEQGAAKREVGGLVTRYGAFASGSYGGILASATRDSVIKHVESMKRYRW
jgi:curli biogenesis system outer membrane secretion channel CsgG